MAAIFSDSSRASLSVFSATRYSRGPLSLLE
jgi:hypothetical protein